MDKKYFSIILIIIVVLGVFVIAFKSSDTKDYLKELSYSELIEKINNKDSFIVYVKQDSCSHCQNFTPVLENVLKKYKIEAYYIRLNTFTEEEKTYTDDGSIINGTDLIISGTPTVIFMNNGKESVMHRIVGEASEDKIITKLKSSGYIK